MCYVFLFFSASIFPFRKYSYVIFIRTPALKKNINETFDWHRAFPSNFSSCRLNCCFELFIMPRCIVMRIFFYLRRCFPVKIRVISSRETTCFAKLKFIGAKNFLVKDKRCKFGIFLHFRKRGKNTRCNVTTFINYYSTWRVILENYTRHVTYSRKKKGLSALFA